MLDEESRQGIDARSERAVDLAIGLLVVRVPSEQTADGRGSHQLLGN
jgi:hypothetical protein